MRVPLQKIEPMGLLHWLFGESTTATSQRHAEVEQRDTVNVVQGLIEQLRISSYREQAAAAEQLGELADPAAEQPLLDSFWGETYRLIDQDGAPGRYFAIISSAAKALAKLNADKAFDSLVDKIRSSPPSDQLGVAAAVYGLSFSPRLGAESILRSINSQIDKDSGKFLVKEIDSALKRIMSRRGEGEL